MVSKLSDGKRMMVMRSGGQVEPGGPGGQRAADEDGRGRRAAARGHQDQPEPVGARQRHLGAGRQQERPRALPRLQTHPTPPRSPSTSRVSPGLIGFYRVLS